MFINNSFLAQLLAHSEPNMPTFMDLPREIRDKIYTQYFTSLPCRSTIQFEQETPTKPSDKWQSYGEDGNYFLNRSIPRTDSSKLFFANRQLHAEATAAFARIFPPTTNPSYSMQICVGTSSHARTSWLHLPFLHPTLDTFDIWLTAPSTAPSKISPAKQDLERVYNTLLDTLERFILRGPDLTAAHGGMGLRARRRKHLVDEARHPEYFFLNKIRVHLPAPVSASANCAGVLGEALKGRFDRAVGELLRAYDPSRISFECREYEGEMARWLVAIQCSGSLEVVQEGEGADEVGKWVW
jgi:hypothetical protein